MLGVIRHASWLAGLLPLAALAWLTFRGRAAEPEDRMLAVAFALSFLADIPARYFMGANVHNLWISYLYVPAQFALVLWVVAPKHGKPVVWLFFALLVMASTFRGPFDMPEGMVQVIAGAWIGLIVFGRPSRYRLALLVYFWASLPFLLLLTGLKPGLRFAWLSAWIGYQLCRIVGLTLFAAAAIRGGDDGTRVLGFPDRGVADPDCGRAVPGDHLWSGARTAERLGWLPFRVDHPGDPAGVRAVERAREAGA